MRQSDPADLHNAHHVQIQCFICLPTLIHFSKIRINARAAGKSPTVSWEKENEKGFFFFFPTFFGCTNGFTNVAIKKKRRK